MTLKFVKYFFWQNWFGSGYKLGQNSGSGTGTLVASIFWWFWNWIRVKIDLKDTLTQKNTHENIPCQASTSKSYSTVQSSERPQIVAQKNAMPTQKNNAKLFAIYRYTFTWFKKYFCGSFYIHIFGQSRCKTGFQPKKMHQRNVTPPIIFRFYWRLLRKLHFFFSNFPFPSEIFLFIYLAFNRSFFRYLHQYSDTCVNIALIYTFPACFVTWFDRFFIGSKKSVLFICMHASKSLWIFDTMVWLFHKKNF